MHWLFYIAALIGILATAEDLYRRRISNITCAAAFVLGLGAQIWLHGLRGAGNSLLGTGTGFLVFLIFFVLGGRGAGDIKLMAGFGSVLGWSQTLMAALLTSIVGGLLALGYLFVRWLVRWLRKSPKDGAEKRGWGKEYIPYAPAITLGVLLSFATR